MLDIDLNLVPDPEVPTLELNGVTLGFKHISKISFKPSVLPMPPGEASSRPKPKRGRPRVSPVLSFTGRRPDCLPDGWIVDERVRLSGDRKGERYKYFIEPETGESFRSLKSVLLHLGLPPKPRKNNPKQSSVRHVSKPLIKRKKNN